MATALFRNNSFLRSWIVGLTLSCLLLGFRLAIQQDITINDGRGWDGSIYYQMAEDIYSLSYIPLPFRLRIGLPFLVHIIPISDTLLKFKLINTFFAIIFSVIAYVGISKYTSNFLTRLVSWLLVCAIPVAPIPFTTWYPTNSDVAPNLLLLILVLFSLEKRNNFIIVMVIFFLGTLFRENFPIFGCLLLLQARFSLEPSPIRLILNNIKNNYSTIINLIGAILGSLIAFMGIYLITGASPLAGKGNVFVDMLISQNLVEVIAAFINIYGILILFSLASYIVLNEKELVSNNKGILLLCLSIFTIISLGGVRIQNDFYIGD